MSNPNEFVSQKGTNIELSKYFSRKVIFTKRDGKIVLVDAHDATASPPLDPWLGNVYMLADGQHTFGQLVEFVSSQYKGNPPGNLKLTLESVLGRLLEAEVVELTDSPKELPYYLTIPVDEQDQEKAKNLMLEDNYMKPKVH